MGQSSYCPYESLLASRAFLRERGLDLPERGVLGRDHVEEDRVLRVLDAVQLADQVLDRKSVV